MKYIKRLIDFLDYEIGDMPAFSYEIVELSEETEVEEHYSVRISVLGDVPNESDKKWHVDFMFDKNKDYVLLGEDYKVISTTNSSIKYFWMAFLFN